MSPSSYRSATPHLVRPERRQGGFQRTVERYTLHRIRRQRRCRFRRGGVVRPRPGIEGHGANPAATHRVYAGVVRDAENPRGQTPGDVECGEIAERFDEGFLSKILRERPSP